MKLTGKCKEDFEKWYIKDLVEKELALEEFYNSSDSMQYGVLVDFFDSVGVNIEVWIEYQVGGVLIDFYAVLVNDENISGGFETRQEARTKAIEKANEIYNAK
jgi:hypothetical protein